MARASQGTSGSRRRRNPYSHWASGLGYELGAFSGLLAVLALIAIAARIIYGS